MSRGETKLGVLDTLITASRRQFVNPHLEVEWPDALGADAWLMSPELISLHGTAAFDAITPAVQQRLSLFEAANFFCLNIHGERYFIGKLVEYMYRNHEPAVDAYLHHFLDEENKHMGWFAEFCRRYAGKVYPDEHLRMSRKFAPGEEEFLFFASVVVFEEITDYFNVQMAKDERLHAVARRINLLHHRDESRHLIFGRKLVADLLSKYRPGWDPSIVQRVRDHLSGFEEATRREYFNPQVYSDAGLEGDPYELQERALQSSSSKDRFDRACRSGREFFRGVDLAWTDPVSA